MRLGEEPTRKTREDEGTYLQYVRPVDDIVVALVRHPPGISLAVVPDSSLQRQTVFNWHLVVLLAVYDEDFATGLLDSINVRKNVKATEHSRGGQHSQSGSKRGVQYETAQIRLT